MYINAGAAISSDGKYRYHLWREWRLHPLLVHWRHHRDDKGNYLLDGAGHRLGEPHSVVFIMLNPSTADGTTDDPTIRRCVGFAKRWGYDRMEVVNLFAYRATDPKELLRLHYYDNPVGDRNSEYIGAICSKAHLVICAWGAHGSHLDQYKTVLGWFAPRPLHALAITKHGMPAHPLYQPLDRQLMRYDT